MFLFFWLFAFNAKNIVSPVNIKKAKKESMSSGVTVQLVFLVGPFRVSVAISIRKPMIGEAETVARLAARNFKESFP